MRSNQEGQNFYQQERVQFVTFHRLKSELYKYYNIYFNKVFVLNPKNWTFFDQELLAGKSY